MKFDSVVQVFILYQNNSGVWWHYSRKTVCRGIPDETINSLFLKCPIQIAGYFAKRLFSI